MILAIDGYEANTQKRVGIGRYSYEILSHIYRLIASRKGNDITVIVYVPEKPLFDMPKETSWWEYRVGFPRQFWTWIGLPFALLTYKRPDVIFSPTHYIPRFVGYPRVMAIMDLSYLFFPGLFRAKDLYQLTHWTKYAVSHAAKILTISSYSRDAIIQAYGVSPDRIDVTYPGMTHVSGPHGEKRASTLSHYGVSGPYILSVGTIQPRKNYIRLIEAFSRLIKENTEVYSAYTLVIVGKPGWLYEDIMVAPKKYHIENQVKFLDYVRDEDLPNLYKHATVFALPSLYEGFGLPVLEAMAYRCPVVVSAVSSLPEVAGEAGIYVHPDSSEDIAAGIDKAVRERGTAVGKERVRVGYMHMKTFTWERAAEKTLEVLISVGRKTV